MQMLYVKSNVALEEGRTVFDQVFTVRQVWKAFGKSILGVYGQKNI